MAATEDWKSKVAEKRGRSEQKIPSEWKLPSSILDLLKFPLDKNPNKLLELDIPRRSGILSDAELDITENYSVSQLLEKLKLGQLSSVDVTVAFSKRAAIAQQLTSCLTETIFEEAQERARYLDEYLKKEGKVVGPLHGLPVSIKDGFRIKGVDASIGYVSLINKPAEENSPLVDLLLDLGAVLYVKTNIPQSLMTADSENNVFGRTLNPHNTTLTAGGSSGGEGALVAFRGSVLGVGTDIAGSIRIPAFCCGTYSFKPSSSRVPFGGQTSTGLPGLRHIISCAGPFAHSVDALGIFMKHVIDARPELYDSTALAIPWQQLPAPSASDKKLTIGVLELDPAYPVQPPVKRSLESAVKRLTEAGHTVVTLPLSETYITPALEVSLGYFMLHSKTTLDLINASGEPKVTSVAKGGPPANFRTWNFVPNLSGLDSLEKLAALNVKRAEIAEAWRKLWRKYNLDLVISPGAQNVAAPHDAFQWTPYTVMLNLLDYPAAIIPHLKASKDIDQDTLKIQPGEVGCDYDPETFDGAPCAIQAFAPNLKDAECLYAAEIVDKSINGA